MAAANRIFMAFSHAHIVRAGQRRAKGKRKRANLYHLTFKSVSVSLHANKDLPTSNIFTLAMDSTAFAFVATSATARPTLADRTPLRDDSKEEKKHT